ncbi:hypothetical protein WJX72_009630 [[Myrmecia] bisecta]|uniref:CHCH domain-containing protein n=1 Tax=[Myrmecia] bisecta TaxID=41462 RepID=A0AAW1PE07_9CHLO
MSAGGAFGGARGVAPKPPEKGVFPLDHFGECKQLKEAYMQCLRDNSGKASSCRDLTKKYLVCRMERNLMAPQSLQELGLGEDRQPPQPGQDALPQHDKRQSGFVAGLRR